ncbi:hypothetical protein pb186bvf_001378 [Paramecium bursaria]
MTDAQSPDTIKKQYSSLIKSPSGPLPHIRNQEKSQGVRFEQDNQPKQQTEQSENISRFRVSKQSSNTVQKNNEYAKNIQKQKSLQQFRESLYYDERINTVPKSTIKNHIIESIVDDADLLLQKKELISSIYKLKQLNLLRNKDFAVNKLPGVGKTSYVYNDYHTKSTNNGYARNWHWGGVFFTR